MRAIEHKLRILSKNAKLEDRSRRRDRKVIPICFRGLREITIHGLYFAFQIL